MDNRISFKFLFVVLFIFCAETSFPNCDNHGNLNDFNSLPIQEKVSRFLDDFEHESGDDNSNYMNYYDSIVKEGSASLPF
jgi:hypothetical protein